MYNHYKNEKKKHQIMKKIKVCVIPPHQDNHFYVTLFVLLLETLEYKAYVFYTL